MNFTCSSRKPPFADFKSHHLVESGGIQVRGLLGLDQFADDLLRCNDPCQADAGSKQFGEGAQINDVSGIAAIIAAVLAVQRRQARVNVRPRTAAARMDRLQRSGHRTGQPVRPIVCGVPG